MKYTRSYHDLYLELARYGIRGGVGNLPQQIRARYKNIRVKPPDVAVSCFLYSTIPK